MKKFLSLLLMAFIIMCMIFPTNVMGAAYSGKCGESASWVLENGVLTISGEGKLYNNYNETDNHPTWFKYRDSIEKVIVEEGITAIYKDTFYQHSNLKSVVFPVTLNSIGYYTFNQCHNIAYIDWKDWNPPMILMYAADGRARLFDTDEVETYKNLGWYTEPVQTLYSLDGRSQVFKKSEVSSQLTVGWYEYPVVTMYALDGRTLAIPNNEIIAYENVGWYYGKPVKLYGDNGKFCWVGENRLDDTVIMYALDGRIQAVNKKDIVANEKVGWYYGKPVTMYSADGRTLIVGENRVEEQKSVGWYTEPIVKMYAVENGNLKTIDVLKSQVAANKKVGWRTDMPKSKQVTGECSSCYGKGSYNCWSCDGKGYTRKLDRFYSSSRDGFDFSGVLEGMPIYKNVDCTSCNGRGTKNCSTCKGKGKISKTVYYY